MTHGANNLRRRANHRAAIFATVLLATCLAAGGALASVTYTYDSLGRLASAVYDTGVTILYTYDINGNRLTQVVNTNASTSTWGSFNWGSGTW